MKGAPVRIYERRFPKWIRTVAITLALATAMGIRAEEEELGLLLGPSVATKVTLFAATSFFVVGIGAELAVRTWACRRWGRCAFVHGKLRFRTPFTDHEHEVVVNPEKIADRAVTRHGVRIFVRGGLWHAFEALLIPCRPGAETDEVLRLLDTPWATERDPHAPPDAGAAPGAPHT